MKVQCKQLNPTDQKSYSNWITEGKVYYVLSIFYDERRIFLYRIIGNDGKTPALYESHLFSPVSSKIPKNWMIDLNEDIFQLAPKAWITPRFWEKYFDGDKEAKNIFDKEIREILNCE